MNWQPIETAPKDGSYVLLLLGGKFVSVGSWDLQKHHSKPNSFWASERGLLFGKTWDRANQPTHWMPLPAPPLSPPLRGS